MRSLLAAALISFAAFAGCGAPCDTNSVCAVDQNNLVCDGTGFIECGDGNRGQSIPCAHRPEVAICTSTGWTWQDAAK